MRRLATAIGVCLLYGCAPVGASTPDVRFEIRGLRLKSEDHASYTSFSNEATVLALGDGDATKQDYLVFIRATHVTGGDPEYAAQMNGPRYTTVLVMDGTGDVEISAGLRDKETSYQHADTWDPEQIKLEVAGFVPITEVHTPQP